MITVIFLILTSICFAVDKPINSFTGGRGSPLMEQRTDFEKYDTLSRQMENMIPFPQGTANKRPGTKYVEPMYVVTFVPGAQIYDSFMISGDTMSIIDSDGEYMTNGTATYVEEDLGGGDYKIAIPWTAHDFRVGEFLLMTNSSFYSYALSQNAANVPLQVVDTTDSIIYVTVNVASSASCIETFDGTEAVTRVIFSGSLNGIHVYDAIQIGDYIWASCQLSAKPIKKITIADWTIDESPMDYTFADSSEKGVAVLDDPDEDSLYLTTTDNGNDRFLYKFDEDGTFVWKSPVETSSARIVTIDPDGRLLSRYAGTGLVVVDQTDGSILESYELGDPDGNGRTFVTSGTSYTPTQFIVSYKDEATGHIVNAVFGNENSDATHIYDYGVSVRCDEANGSHYVWYAEPLGNGNDFSVDDAIYYDGYVFTFDKTDVITHNGTPTNLFRWKFNVAANGDVTLGSLGQWNLSNAYNMSVGPDGYLWIIYDISEGDTLVKYNSDMTEIESLDLGWDPPQWPSQWNLIEDEITEASVTVELSTDALDAFRLIPFEYSTDDAYVLAFGENSLGFFRNGGQVEQ